MNGAGRRDADGWNQMQFRNRADRIGAVLRRGVDCSRYWESERGAWVLRDDLLEGRRYTYFATDGRSSRGDATPPAAHRRQQSLARYCFNDLRAARRAGVLGEGVIAGRAKRMEEWMGRLVVPCTM